MDPTTTPPSPMLTQSDAPSESAAPARSAKPVVKSPPEDPESSLEEIRAHLGEGRYRRAQRLAREAAVRFPEPPEVHTMNRGLNEWTSTTRPATGVDRSDERKWMRQDPPESLRGRLVALVGSEVVACADTVDELSESLRSKDLPKPPLVLRVG